LLKSPKVTAIDLFEKFPVPFGLVRYGVAPDHPEVKNVEHSFTKIAENDRVSFIGNVNIGSNVPASSSDSKSSSNHSYDPCPNPGLDSISLTEIRSAYNVVVLCYGSARERELGIHGEHLSNVISARRFVGWYNGVPQDQDLKVNVDTDTCIIIGHGNVALDCARILVAPIDNGLGKTDITSKATELLKQSKIKNVHVIGRRGPLQVAFTIKEFRELTKIPDCHTFIDPNELSFLRKEHLDSMPRARRRLSELLLNVSKAELNQASSKRCFINFRMSPLSISNLDKDLKVDFAINSLSDPLDPKSKAIDTNERIVKSAGLVIKSIGYATVALDPSLPMDEKRGCIVNEGGRVGNKECDVGNGLYCSGWAATGASGVLIGTMNVSFEVAKRILSDAESGKIDVSEKPGGDQIRKLLSERNVKFVSFDDWKKIDIKERKVGEEKGKPREKLVSISDFVAAVEENQEINKS
jgi:adrenodoxin-NADP+ reductase